MRVKIDPIDKWVEATVSEMLAPAARSKAVADFARKELVEALDGNRRAMGSFTPYEQFVDGRKGAALESVNPDRGVIVFEFELVAEVLRWIHAELVERSPRGPVGGAGTYRDQHRLFADGREITLGPDLPEAEEYSFLNTTPYSRKIEIGTTESGRAFVIKAEPRLYDHVSAEAARRFSRVVKISYTFRPLVGGYRTKRGAMRYPTITVRMT